MSKGAKEQNLRKNLSDWFKKEADKIGDFCAVIPFVAAAFIAAVFFFSDWGFTAQIPILVAAILLSSVSFYFLWKAVYLKCEKIRDEKSRTTFVISAWSLETLRAVGVPRDIIKYLAEPLTENGKMSTSKAPQILKESDNTYKNWLEKFKKEIGEDRVTDSIELIRKYTRRIE